MRLRSDRLIQKRSAFGLSQEALGELVGLSQKQISKYETGESDPRGESLAALANALDTTTDWLLGLTDNTERPMRNTGDLSREEQELLEIYRRIPRDRRTGLVQAVKALAR